MQGDKKSKRERERKRLQMTTKLCKKKKKENKESKARQRVEEVQHKILLAHYSYSCVRTNIKKERRRGDNLYAPHLPHPSPTATTYLTTTTKRKGEERSSA